MAAFPQAQVTVWKRMGHHPQRERPADLAQFIEAACTRCPSERATRQQSRRTHAPAVGSTPQPLAPGTGDLPAVA
jgi:hypothetical protein